MTAGSGDLAVFAEIVTSTSTPGARQPNLNKVKERFQICHETGETDTPSYRIREAYRLKTMMTASSTGLR